jgi:AcrR family transcriptional regulator
MSLTHPQPALRPRKRPLQARSRVTVAALVEAAVRILLAEGHRRLTTRRVAEVAGVSVGSLYQYFPNREAILAEVIRHKVEDSLRALAEAAERAAGPPEEALAGVMAAFAAEKRRGLALSRALSGTPVGAERRRAIAAGAVRAEAVLAALLERLVGRALDQAERLRLSIAVAALEGVVAKAAERDPGIFADPGFGGMLSRMLLAALEGG